MKILTCKKCVIPNTKPGIVFKDGICSACLFHEKKNSFSQNIDWKKRRDEFSKLINIIKKKNVPNYHVLVPVSGGKDGSYVAYQLKHKYGMNPLAITVKPALSLEIGDSLVESIQKGIKNSFYGLIVLSENFFNKQWPKKELNSLFTKEIVTESNLLIPVWLNISFKEVFNYS